MATACCQMVIILLWLAIQLVSKDLLMSLWRQCTQRFDCMRSGYMQWSWRGQVFVFVAVNIRYWANDYGCNSYGLAWTMKTVIRYSRMLEATSATSSSPRSSGSENNWWQVFFCSVDGGAQPAKHSQSSPSVSLLTPLSFMSWQRITCHQHQTVCSDA